MSNLDKLDRVAESLIRAYQREGGEFCIVIRTLGGDAKSIRAIYHQIGAVPVAQLLNRAADMIFDGSGTIENVPDGRAN